MAKAQGPRCKGRCGLISKASRKAKKPHRGFQERFSALSASSSVIFLFGSTEDTEKERSFIPQYGKITTNRRGAGGRRENEIFIKSFVFLAFRKKNLCGLCVLSGSILSFIPGGYEDFYNFLCKNKLRQNDNQLSEPIGRAAITPGE
jgi:hypothetical protein